MEPERIRYSELRALKRCKQQWKYSWVDQLQASARPFAMDVGDLGHRCLDYYYTGRDWEEALDKAVLETEASEANEDEFVMENFYEAVETVKEIMPNYIAFAKEQDPLWFRKIYTVEKRLEAPIPSLISYAKDSQGVVFSNSVLSFKCDMIVETTTGSVALWENKFVKQAPGGYEYLEYDEQTHTYLWGMQHAYARKKVDTVIFNLIRHKPTKKQPDLWVIREKTYRTQDQLAMIGYELAIALAERDHLLKGIENEEDVIYRHMSRGCLDCVFRGPCIGELKALDMSVLWQERFKQEAHRL